MLRHGQSCEGSCCSEGTREGRIKLQRNGGVEAKDMAESQQTETSMAYTSSTASLLRLNKSTGI